MSEPGDAPARYASSPCMASEVAPGYFDPLGVDAEQARDVARWRKAIRVELLARRNGLTVAARRAVGKALADHVLGLVTERFGEAGGFVFSAYWPIQGEPDLRPLMEVLHRRGVTVALPLVETRSAPLVFRRWTPGTRMVRGHWNILVPPPDAPELTPDVTLTPLVGWDGEGFRLGYGGGYFDRTLAALSPRPFTIGVGFADARLKTIFPQPHDIPLDAIVTDAGRAFLREEP